MSGYHDRLQGTDRLLRIRRIRKAVFAGLFALGIVLIFARLEGEGTSLKPFFLPVNGIIEVALIMGLTASIIGLFLRNLEIRHALRDNQRFLMAKSSMTRALRTAAFAIGLAIALLLAITPSLATTLFSDPLQVVSLRPNGSEVVTFTSPDALGLPFRRPISVRTRVTSLRAAAEIDSGGPVYAPSAPMADAAPTARPVPMKSSFVEPLPPTPSTPPPPPVPAPVIQASTHPIQAPTPPLPRPTPRAPVREPETAETLVRKAAALVATGNHEAALVGFVEALRLDSEYVPALQGKARCQERLKQHVEALETYRRILAKDRRNVDSLRAVARLHMEERHWRECLESVEDLLRLRPNEAAALEMKGDALTNLGRRPEALAAYEAAATVDSSDQNLRQKIEEVRVDVPSLLSRALIASASGDYTADLNLFDDILEVEPSNGNALIGKAVAYRRSGKPQEALNCLDLVLGVQPGNSSALLNRGTILLEQGDLEDALDSFDRLTQLYPNDEEAW